MAYRAAWKSAALCLSVFFIVCHAHDARAELRQYIDEKGRMHLTDDSDALPDMHKYVDEKGQLHLTDNSEASASMFQYIDEKGRVHLTNDRSRIPSEYSESASAISKSDEGPAELPEQVIGAFSGDKEDTWLKYKQMGWFKKNALIARAGFSDIKVVLDDLKVQLLLLTLLFVGMAVYAILKLDKFSHKLSVVVMLLFCYGQVYLAMHIKSTKGQGSSILSNLSQMQSLSKGQGALTAGEAVSSSEGGEGGLVGSLQNLQGMNAERQDLFRMILEED